MVTIPQAPRILYDLGANNGDDLPYYFLRADLVVAVEANPQLCRLIHGRFAAELKSGKLIVENCVVTAEGEGGLVNFYLHRTNHVLSQLPAPEGAEACDFDKVVLPCKPVTQLLADHGDPYYIKIDIERYDGPILEALFAAGVFPPFLSAEAHSAEVLDLLISQGHYDAFKLVDGRTVSSVYSRCPLGVDADGEDVSFSFPRHAAGPFGNDVQGEWMDAPTFRRVMALEKWGWKDIHATRREVTGPWKLQGFGRYFVRYLVRKVRQKASGLVRRVRRLRRGS